MSDEGVSSYDTGVMLIYDTSIPVMMFLHRIHVYEKENDIKTCMGFLICFLTGRMK